MDDYIWEKYAPKTPQTPNIVWLLRNSADRCKMTCRWLCIRQIRNRK